MIVDIVWVTDRKRRLRLRCDHCDVVFEREYRKKYLGGLHFCCHTHSNKAQKLGGKLDAKKRLIFIDKYGVDNPSKSKDIQIKKQKTLLENFEVIHNSKISSVIEKRKKTSLKKWGYDNPMKSPVIQQKMSLLWHSKSISEKKSIQAKRAETNIKKYGSISPMGNELVKAKVDWKEAFRKQHATKKARGTYGKSRIEEYCFELLVNVFGHKNIERQAVVNGWNIDFYIKSVGVYLQVDGSYWHGLNRPICEIINSKKVRDKKIHKTYFVDMDQNSWFAENQLSLARLLDTELLKMKASKNYTLLISEILASLQFSNIRSNFHFYEENYMRGRYLEDTQELYYG